MKPITSGTRAIVAILAAAVGAHVLPTPAEAMPRKCSVPAGSTRPAVGGTPLLMVDGIVVGEYGTAGVGISYSTPSGVVTIGTDEIDYLQIICLEHEKDGQVVARQAISVGTRSGIEGMMRRYLAELADLQEDYRNRNGAYAAALSYLGFHLTRHPLPIELIVIDGGWSGSARIGAELCRIAVGRAATNGTTPGRVECVSFSNEPDGTGPASIQLQKSGSDS